MILDVIFRPTLDKGPRSRIQRNWIFLLVKSFKLVPGPLESGSGPRQIKLWFSLHGIILKGKSIDSDHKKKKL
jgi:hypothetical protein